MIRREQDGRAEETEFIISRFTTTNMSGEEKELHYNKTTMKSCEIIEVNENGDDQLISS